MFVNFDYTNLLFFFDSKLKSMDMIFFFIDRKYFGTTNWISLKKIGRFYILTNKMGKKNAGFSN